MDRVYHELGWRCFTTATTVHHKRPICAASVQQCTPTHIQTHTPTCKYISKSANQQPLQVEQPSAASHSPPHGAGGSSPCQPSRLRVSQALEAESTQEGSSLQQGGCTGDFLVAVESGAFKAGWQPGHSSSAGGARRRGWWAAATAGRPAALLAGTGGQEWGRQGSRQCRWRKTLHAQLVQPAVGQVPAHEGGGGWGCCCCYCRAYTELPAGGFHTASPCSMN
jgi:hypothetical protein